MKLTGSEFTLLIETVYNAAIRTEDSAFTTTGAARKKRFAKADRLYRLHKKLNAESVKAGMRWR